MVRGIELNDELEVFLCLLKSFQLLASESPSKVSLHPRVSLAGIGRHRQSALLHHLVVLTELPVALGAANEERPPTDRQTRVASFQTKTD